MTGLNRRLAVLFVASLLGALTVVGVALAQVGWWAVTPYAVVMLTGLGLLLRQARALRVKQREGRTCSCCTSTVFDPVEVV